LLFKNYFISLQPEAEKIIPIIGQEKVFLLPTPHRMLRDLKSLIILLILELAYCIASSFLPRHALLVTALREARRIMKPLSLWLGESPLRGALSEQYPDSVGEVRVIPIKSVQTDREFGRTVTETAGVAETRIDQTSAPKP
jgi:hypothetical protein